MLEEYALLLVLASKQLLTFPLEALDPGETQSPLIKRPKKIASTNFFKAGVCLGRHLVCCVKTSALSTTIKVFEPMDSSSKGKKKPAFSKMFQGGQDALKAFKVCCFLEALHVIEWIFLTNGSCRNFIFLQKQPQYIS